MRDLLGKFNPQALLCTDPVQNPMQVLRWLVQRWQVGITFREARDHLGVETQRHREAIRPEGRKREGACKGSDPAIARTTSACSAWSPSSPCWQPSSRPRRAEPQPPAPGIASSA